MRQGCHLAVTAPCQSPSIKGMNSKVKVIPFSLVFPRGHPAPSLPDNQFSERYLTVRAALTNACCPHQESEAADYSLDMLSFLMLAFIP